LSQSFLFACRFPDRQLLRRRKLSAAEAIEQLVGMQAQAPNAPYVGLWTPPERFHLDELARLITEWRAVCIALLRNTIHLVTARNCLALRPLVQPVFDRHLNANRTHRTLSKRIDRAAPS
jgi:Winged helix DNA-binding domain